jgi:F0F1-type ATP synthase assembly protein I
MRRVALGLLILLIALLLVYRFAMPFTPAWIDLLLIGLCVAFLLVVRVTMDKGKEDAKPTSGPQR